MTPGVRGAVKALFRPHHVEKTAVEGVSFEVERGEMVGYIGVNGAGKSTTIKMLTGILLPTSGTVRVLGRDPHRERVANARRIGVVFGQRSQLWWDLALIESLDMIARMYEVPPARYRSLLDEFSESLELEELLSVPVRIMSLGQKMRSELAASPRRSRSSPAAPTCTCPPTWTDPRPLPTAPPILSTRSRTTASTAALTGSSCAPSTSTGSSPAAPADRRTRTGTCRSSKEIDKARTKQCGRGHSTMMTRSACRLKKISLCCAAAAMVRR
ncbi:MAG TPA: ATP-binding cassette domain-containing protein [Anaerolineales bacterium]|nr:ATP-binding cassette domain-containing protein [Anaerolineales bacterium]